MSIFKKRRILDRRFIPFEVSGPPGKGVAQGGTTGQILVKSSNTDYETTWQSGGTGTVTNVSSSNSDISVSNGTTTPQLSLNSGTGANQIVKLDSSAKLPAVDGSQLTGLPGGGTVTTVSVSSANGFGGTVANPSSTPAITITTSISGIVKGNGTAISAATVGTDYSAGTSALATGILKSTTTTGALTIAVAGDFPTLNQNTTGSAATLTTPRAIYGNNFDGSAALTEVIASTYGGTGNGFTKFSGPTTAEKTFTLPDSSQTLLYSGGALGTPSGGTLTNCGSLPISGLTPSTSTALGVGSIELGHATDTTIARVSAGVVSIESSNIMTVGSTDTITGAKTFNGTVVLGEVSMQLDPAISADGKWSGITETGTAGAALTFGQLCYFQAADSRWELADANLSAGYDKKLGMCVLAAAGDGNATEMLLIGKINAAAQFPTLTIGSPVYMSETAGAVVVAQPTTADVCIRVIGYANTADELYFNPSSDYIVHV